MIFLTNAVKYTSTGWIKFSVKKIKKTQFLDDDEIMLIIKVLLYNVTALHKAGIEINRKVLADLAVNHPEAFKAIVAKVK